jgi:glycerol-3-phosphate O-acyltransferase / dihydroxyacetone phosphate acyltransferase
MDEYKEQFFSDLEGAPRAAAKRLTGAIERELVEATINAPDWYFKIVSLRCVRTLIMC